jgi:hypothetical protein
LRLEPEDLATFEPMLVALLHSKIDGVRVLAVACLHRLADRARLEAILDEYMQTRPYYYNVVCWLDRVLYAPAPLQDMFARWLSQGGRRWTSLAED